MMRDDPLFSIIIPIFNRSWQLRRSLESLKSQTFKDFEVIVCDDGSTEDIASVVKEFEQILDIGLNQIPNWGGPAKPRNEGLKLAQGEWIAFLDSDDWWDENRLEAVAQALSESVDFLYHPLRVIREFDSGSSREKRSRLGDPLNGDPFQQMLLLGNPIPTSAAVVRKDLILSHGGMSEERGLIALEDFDCWLRLASSGAHFYFLNQCLGNYWVGSDAISTISPKQIDGQKLLYQRIESRINQTVIRSALGRQNYVLGLLYFKIGNPHLAFKHLKLACPLSSWKLLTKRWVLIGFSLIKMAEMKLHYFLTGAH
jgi:glycosyltransferase involved in cell wall biosynthesis